jgi:hypothetical protein
MVEALGITIVDILKKDLVKGKIIPYTIEKIGRVVPF